MENRERFAAMQAEREQQRRRDEELKSETDRYYGNSEHVAEAAAILHQEVRRLLGRDAAGVERRMKQIINSHHDEADELNATYDRLRAELDDADQTMWKYWGQPQAKSLDASDDFYRQRKEVGALVERLVRAKQAFEEFKRSEIDQLPSEEKSQRNAA